MSMSIEPLGWGSFFADQVDPLEQATLLLGRAVADRGPRLLARFSDATERLVVVPGRLRAAGELPVVGDFLLAEPSGPGEDAVVVRVLARRSALSRNAAGRGVVEQVLAANVDVAFLVAGLDAGVNPRRIERTLAAVHAGGIEPVVVLTKADVCRDPSAAIAEAQGSAGEAPVLVASGVTGEGVDALRALLAPGRTGVLVGPSGSGKSTLTNALLGEMVQATGDVRARDHRGRHVTTGRRLVALPSGGCVVDGPGIRELQLWDGTGVEEAFDDVGAIAQACRYRDCRHAGEPGCAVLAAVADGRLGPERLASLHKLEREVAAHEARRDAGNTKRRMKAISREIRRLYRDRGRE